MEEEERERGKKKKKKTLPQKYPCLGQNFPHNYFLMLLA